MTAKTNQNPLKKRKKRQLTPKEELFCQELVKCGNQTRAAITAGYAVASAAVTGAKLVIKPNIKKRIEELR